MRRTAGNRGNGSAPIPWWRDHFSAWLALLVGLGILLRVGYVLTIGRHTALGLDAIWYLLVGSGLALGHGYSDPSAYLLHGVARPTANFTPGYPFVVAGLYKVGVTTATGVRLAGACLGGVTIAATGFLGRRLGGRSDVGLVAGGVVALSPSLMASDGSLMSESVAVPLMALLLLSAHWASTGRSPARWLVAGALGGLLALCRSEDLLVVLVLLPVVIVVGPALSVRRRLLLVGTALAGTALLVVPWVVRNSLTFHPDIPISTAADKTIAGANCPSTYSGPLTGYWDFACLGRPDLANGHEAAYAHALETEGADYLRGHLARLPDVVVVRVLRGWGLYAPIQESRLSGLETRSVGWQELAWPVSLVVLLVAIPGIARLRRDRVALSLVLGPILLDSVVLAATYGNDRFVLTAVPSLAVGVGSTWAALRDRRRNRLRAVAEPLRPAGELGLSLEASEGPGAEREDRWSTEGRSG